MKKKLKSKETSPLALILTALSGLSLGLLGAVALLLSTPVEKLSQPRKENVSQPGDYTASYLLGKVAAMEDRTLRSRLGRLKVGTPGPVSFSPDELNRMIDEVINPRKAPQAAGEKKEEAPPESAKIEFVNLNIVENEMTWSVKMVVNPTTDRFELLTQIKAEFVNTEAGPQFKVLSCRVNSLPIPLLGGSVGKALLAGLSTSAWPQDYVEMWNNVREVEIKSNQFITLVGPKKV